MTTLGRHFVRHDPRSRAFGVAEALGTVERKPTFWEFPIWSAAPFNQAAEGACTAFSLAHELAAGPVRVRGMSNYWARSFYRKIQSTDRAMGNDFPEGATMLASAKTAQENGLITGYRWCFGAEQVADTLCSVGPVWLGIPWYSGMYEARDGIVTVEGELVGGHAITAVGYDVHPEHGPMVAWVNSWGRSYGVPEPRAKLRGGVGYVRLCDLNRLLAENGEAIIASDYLR